ncbi:White collar 1 [Hyphodiscus hymeniophilus]|uniref:White collar 1 n=1 Tax=Hyphodiscus hymeniophilus TaxID=353542 RepID=A0A9P6VP30_9HELO|nr:White collar 1 [Hyphodiscus hymeniophilus]
MDREYQAQLQRLQQNLQNLQNGWSSAPEPALAQNSGQSVELVGEMSGREVENEPLQDPLIYPGLYAPSGFDMMGILVRVRTRPNPTIAIGSIDSSVALVLCDTALPDNPIVYCSEPFEALTGYSSTEVMGRNCRFLQHPHPSARNNVKGAPEVEALNKQARAQLRDKITRVRVANYTKGGVTFFNLLTIIPIAWDEGEAGKRYIVGFQAQEIPHFR